MTAQQTDAITDPQSIIAALQQRLDAALSEKATLAEELAARDAALALRNSEFGERIEQQSAAIDVLKVMSASPGDPQPVFELIVRRAAELCESRVGLFEFDGSMHHLRAMYGFEPDVVATYSRLFPQPLDLNGSHTYDRAVMERQIIHIRDIRADPVISGTVTTQMLDGSAVASIPLLRDGLPIGVIGMNGGPPGGNGFSESQIELLKTFAEQAVIAITSAETYRALQTRTSDLQESLEYQTATSDVLKVISRSSYDLKAVLQALLDTAARLCAADFGALMIRDGDVFRTSAIIPISPEHEAFVRRKVFVPSPHGSVVERTAFARQITHTEDIATLSDYVTSGRGFLVSGTALGVPLFLEGDVVGVFTLHRQRTEPFTDAQIELVSTFVDQAAIAIENTRLLTEQREALEQQTATAEVLQVINASPGNLQPVFDAIMARSLRLCDAAFGLLGLYEDDHASYRAVAMHNVPDAVAELFRDKRGVVPESSFGRMARGESPIHVIDAAADEVGLVASPMRRAVVEIGGAHTTLWVALRKDQHVLGAIVAWRREIKAFSLKQIALLENFAAQAVIAIENARLLDEIRQRQEELRVIFENMGDGVAMFDETQHLVAWNRKFQDILDVPDDIIARRQTFSEYVRYLAERGEYGREADPEEHVRRLIEQAGQSRTYERTRPDGRVIEIRHNPVAGGGFVLIYADITERKRSEAEIRAARDAAEEASRTIEAAYRDLKTAQANLIQAEKMASLGQVTAGIAHEIKNPLNFVNNFAALSVDLLSELKETAAPGFAALTDDQRAEIDDVSAMLTSNLEKITEHGKRADGIVTAMLEHSRGSSAERRMVDLNALIDEALNLGYHGARAQDQSFNITLERDFAQAIAPIEVNPQDMTRVFLNIFSNGFYAATRRARNGGTAGFVPMLKVTTRDAGEIVEIRVRDNGSGIPTDIRDKLFQPFFTTKPTGEGTGLGLSITYDIVTKQHGGTIAVDSEVDEFTEFVITLPRQMFATEGDRA